MEETTAGTEAMRIIVDAVHPVLKVAGYRKRRHAFNRVLDDGLTHVVHFQRGQKPGWYDLFTVNAGIFAPEAFVVGYPDRQLPAFVNEYDCQIRQRIGLIIGDRDLWWNLAEEDPYALGEAMKNSIEGPVLSWLDERASSRTALLDYYERNDVGRAGPALAAVAAERGEIARASRFIQQQLDRIAGLERTRESDVRLHRGWIEQISEKYIRRFELTVSYPVLELTI